MLDRALRKSHGFNFDIGPVRHLNRGERLPQQQTQRLPLSSYDLMASWPEDDRRSPNGDQAAMGAVAALAAPRSRTWGGYRAANAVN